MRNSALIRSLLCAAIALGSQSPTLLRADEMAMQPPPPHAQANWDAAPAAVNSGAPAASLQLNGDPVSVRLQTRRTSVASALAALGAAYHVTIRSAVTLDDLRDGTYRGPLRYVIARLLDGYNYVIEEDGVATLEVLVVGKSDGKATPAPTMPVVRQHRIPVTYSISGVRP
jgi:hypothetical protein